MNWKKIFAIVRREYVERVRTKAFWIATLLIPILFLGFIAIQISISRKTGGARRIAVASSRVPIPSCGARLVTSPSWLPRTSMRPTTLVPCAARMARAIAAARRARAGRSSLQTIRWAPIRSSGEAS